MRTTKLKLRRKDWDRNELIEMKWCYLNDSNTWKKKEERTKSMKTKNESSGSDRATQSCMCTKEKEERKRRRRRQTTITVCLQLNACIVLYRVMPWCGVLSCRLHVDSAPTECVSLIGFVYTFSTCYEIRICVTVHLHWVWSPAVTHTHTHKQ